MYGSSYVAERLLTVAARAALVVGAALTRHDVGAVHLLSTTTTAQQ